jgi:predicted kinase
MSDLHGKKLLMTIGLPFSGKSTLATEYEKNDWEVIRRDQLLEEIIQGKEFKSRVEKEVEQHPQLQRGHLFEIRNQIAIEMPTQEVARIVAESDHKLFFYDGTNLYRETRAGVIGLSREGLSVSGVYLKVPFEELKRRIETSYESKERETEFNHAAFRFDEFATMISRFEEPTKEEGFEELSVLHENGREHTREFRHKFL